MQPKLALHPCHPRYHATQASTLSTLHTTARYPHKHATHAIRPAKLPTLARIVRHFSNSKSYSNAKIIENER